MQVHILGLPGSFKSILETNPIGDTTLRLYCYQEPKARREMEMKTKNK